MANKQTRRSVSLSRATHQAALSLAAQRGIPLSQLVQAALVAYGVVLATAVPVAARSRLGRSAVGSGYRVVLGQARPREVLGDRERTLPIRKPSRERQVLGEMEDKWGFV